MNKIETWIIARPPLKNAVSESGMGELGCILERFGLKITSGASCVAEVEGTAEQIDSLHTAHPVLLIVKGTEA